jgi:predicted phosphohydrolase
VSVYAISDLHLAFFTEKPMDIFGEHWEDHAAKIKENWTRVIREDDLVVLPGDISWAMTLDEFLSDIMFIEELPGYKIISKGNHDYWRIWIYQRVSFRPLHSLCPKKLRPV